MEASLYGQEPEFRFLARVIAKLDDRRVVDVGAERGSLVEAMLQAGATQVHAVEPAPDNVHELRERWTDDERVFVHACAAGETDGAAELRLASDPDGSPLSWGHSLLQRRVTDVIEWTKTIPVDVRSLGSMAVSGEIPGRVGIVKIDTEGNDLAVARGMGTMDADLVMVEHWTKVTGSLGCTTVRIPCPWTPEELVETMKARGFNHFACVLRHGEFFTFKWNDANAEPEAFGNAIFIHDRVIDRVLSDVFELAGHISKLSADTGQMYAVAARERLALIERLHDDAAAMRDVLGW
jgi:FkbM family methyltransferase